MMRTIAVFGLGGLLPHDWKKREALEIMRRGK